MVLDVIFRPTKAFEKVFEDANISSALIVVLLTGLFLGLMVFFATALLLPSVYIFTLNIIQWIVLSGVVWFFEFIHVRKRKKMAGTNFEQSACVVGKLWSINLVASVLFAMLALILPFASTSLLFILTPILLVIGLVLLLAWIVASFKMLKVVLGVSGAKLFINWIIVNVLNVSIIALLTALFSILL